MTLAAEEGGRLAHELRKQAVVLKTRDLVIGGVLPKRRKELSVTPAILGRMLETLGERQKVCGIFSSGGDEHTAELEARFHHHGQLSDDGDTFVVNPIDGRKNYSESDVSETAPNYGSVVNLARGRDIIAGVTHLPELGITMATLRGGGTFINGERIFIQDDVPFSFDNPVRVHNLGDEVERLFPNNPYPRSASVVMLKMLQGKLKAYLVGAVAVSNFGSNKTMYEEAGGVVRDWEGRPLRSSDLMRETQDGAILRGFIGMAPSDAYFQAMMNAIRERATKPDLT